MKKKNKNSPVLLFCWFDKAEWTKLRKLSPDGLDDSYESWHKDARRSFAEIKSQGHNVSKAPIRIDAFKKWCDANGRDYSSASRSQYVIRTSPKKIK